MEQVCDHGRSKGEHGEIEKTHGKRGEKYRAGGVFFPWGTGLFDIVEYSSAYALLGVDLAVLVAIVCKRLLSPCQFRDSFIYLTKMSAKGRHA